MMNYDSYLVAKNLVKTKRSINVLCAWSLTWWGVLITLTLLRALLVKQGYVFPWFNLLIDDLGHVGVTLLAFWFAFVAYGAICGLYACVWQTRDLRNNLLPPMPSKIDFYKGSELMEKRKRAREWINQSFVASCGRHLMIIIVRLPRFVEDEIDMEESLNRVASRLARANRAHYGAWEDLVIGTKSPKYYKFVVLRT